MTHFSGRRQLCIVGCMPGNFFVSAMTIIRDSISVFLKKWRWPTPLQIVSAITFSVALISGTLMIIAMVLNELVMISNTQNIYYVPPTSAHDSLGTLDSNSKVLLIPQIDISIGLSRACVGSMCHNRNEWTAAPTLLLPLAESKKVLPTKNLQDAYEYANAQFVMNYKMNCGIDRIPNSRVRAFCDTALVMSGMTLLTITALIVVGMVLHGILTRSDVFYGLEYEDPKTRCVVVGIKQEDAPFFLAQTHLHLKYELRLLKALILLAFANELFSVTTMVLMLYLVQHRMKCSRSMCNEFYSAMSILQDTLTKSGSTSFSSQNTECAPGLTFTLFIVVCFLCTIVLICTLILYWVYNRSNRYPRLQQRKLSLERFWKTSRENNDESNILTDNIQPCLHLQPENTYLDNSEDASAVGKGSDHALSLSKLGMSLEQQHNLSLQLQYSSHSQDVTDLNAVNAVGQHDKSIISSDSSAAFRSGDCNRATPLVVYLPRAIEGVAYAPPRVVSSENTTVSSETTSCSREGNITEANMLSLSPNNSRKMVSSIPRESFGDERVSMLLSAQPLVSDPAPASKPISNTNALEPSTVQQISHSDDDSYTYLLNLNSGNAAASKILSRSNSSSDSASANVLWPQIEHSLTVKKIIGNPLAK